MNWEYVAGLFDGEGNVTITSGKYCELSIGVTNKEVIENLHQFLGGRITSFQSKYLNSKRLYRWYTADHILVKSIAENLIPYSVIKKQSLIEAVKAIDSHTYYDMRRKEIDEKCLIHQYQNEKKSLREISLQMRISQETLRFRLKKLGIPLRSKGAWQTIRKEQSQQNN